MADDEEEDFSILGQIAQSAKLEGFKEGTKEFEKRRRQLQVIRCREMRGLATCTECIAQDDCSLYMQVKRDHHDL